MDKMLKTLQVGPLSYVTNVCGLKNFPISTVAFVIQRPDGKILLIRRSAGAYAGEWVICGGQQCRGETIEEALWQVAGNEIGLTKEDTLSVKFSHVQDVFRPGGEDEEGLLPAYHSVWHFYVLQVHEDFVADGTSSDHRWANVGEFVYLPEPVARALVQATNKYLL